MGLCYGSHAPTRKKIEVNSCLRDAARVIAVCLFVCLLSRANSYGMVLGAISFHFWRGY